MPETQEGGIVGVTGEERRTCESFPQNNRNGNEEDTPMKRYLVACVLALALVAMADQKASAWSKFNFNVGLNVSREASDNSFLWGLIRNGQHPYAQAYGGGGGGYGYDGHAAAPYYAPTPAAGG